MEKKMRLSVYLDPDLMRLLADFAARRDQSRSLIAEAAMSYRRLLVTVGVRRQRLELAI
jgi:predicted transcriptional regulator